MHIIFCVHIKTSLSLLSGSLDNRNSRNKQREFGSGVSNDCTLFQSYKITFIKFKLSPVSARKIPSEGHSPLGFLRAVADTP